MPFLGFELLANKCPWLNTQEEDSHSVTRNFKWSLSQICCVCLTSWSSIVASFTHTCESVSRLRRNISCILNTKHVHKTFVAVAKNKIAHYVMSSDMLFIVKK